MKKRRGRTNGFSGRFVDCFDVGNGLPAPQEELRGSDGSAEKVKVHVESVFDKPIRLNVQTSALRPDDQIDVVQKLEGFGYAVRVLKNNIFLDTHFRITLDGNTVHVVDLRCCN